MSHIFWWNKEWITEHPTGEITKLDWISHDATFLSPAGYLELTASLNERKFLLGVGISKYIPNRVSYIRLKSPVSSGIFEFDITFPKSKTELVVSLVSAHDSSKNVSASFKFSGIFNKRCKKILKVNVNEISFWEKGKIVKKFETFSNLYYIELRLRTNKKLKSQEIFRLNSLNIAEVAQLVEH